MFPSLRTFLARWRATNSTPRTRSMSSRSLAAVEKEITPFFMSVHAYVALAEELPPLRLAKLMNVYFTACLGEIEAEGGITDKLVGDTIVAMFGAPVGVPVTDHALRACVAALNGHARIAELRERLARDRERWPARVLALRARIGLHTGQVVLGPMGSFMRPNYTMMGDSVNLAARLETLAKHYGVWTLCTEETRRACEAASPGRILFRALGPIIIKGRVAPVEIVEPIAFAKDATDPTRECLHTFAQGLARWRERDWTGATRHFEHSAKLERDQPDSAAPQATNPSLVFLRASNQPRPSK